MMDQARCTPRKTIIGLCSCERAKNSMHPVDPTLGKVYAHGRAAVMPTRWNKCVLAGGIAWMRCGVASCLLAAVACSHSKLDASFGVRNRDIFRAQTSARNARDIMVHGQEAESAVAKHYIRVAPDAHGAASNPAASTGLKIPGLSPP